MSLDVVKVYLGSLCYELGYVIGMPMLYTYPDIKSTTHKVHIDIGAGAARTHVNGGVRLVVATIDIDLKLRTLRCKIVMEEPNVSCCTLFATYMKSIGEVLGITVCE